MTFAAPAPSVAVHPVPRPTFSVIVAAWQVADVIGAALRSALAQTRPPLEIIVCDDGSTDDLVAAVAPFGTAVQLISVPHGGAAAASNAGAARARGDFVAILDADDTWHPRRLERLGDLAVARPDLDLLTTDAWFVVDGERRGRFYDSNEFAVREQATEILRRTFFFAHVAVRRTRWIEVGGFAAGLARGYDWDLQLRLLLTGSVAGCVLEPLADYTIHASSLSADRYESLMARVELLDRAAATQRLTRAQQDVLTRARTGYRHRAFAARAERALLDGAPGRRRAAARLAVTRGGGPRSRAFAAVAMLAPGWAGRRLRHEAEARGRARSDRVLPA